MQLALALALLGPLPGQEDELRIGEPLPAGEVSAERLQEEVEKLRGKDL